MNGVAVLLMVLGFPALVALFSIWRGFVLSVMWGWFIVPAFGLPPLSIPLAIGLALVAGVLGSQVPPKRDAVTWVPFVAPLLTPALALLIGWIVKGFL